MGTIGNHCKESRDLIETTACIKLQGLLASRSGEANRAGGEVPEFPGGGALHILGATQEAPGSVRRLREERAGACTVVSSGKEPVRQVSRLQGALGYTDCPLVVW